MTAGHPPRVIIPPVSVQPARWAAALRFLMGGGARRSPNLTPMDHRILRTKLRGPHVEGMGEADARSTLRSMGWRT